MVGLHVAPQAPQSVCVLRGTQVELQKPCPDIGQVQVPFAQMPKVEQEFPQRPQSNLAVFRSTQDPKQFVKFGGHSHRPF